MRVLAIAAACSLAVGLVLVAGCTKEPGTSTAQKPPEGNPHKGYCVVMGESVDYAKADADPKLHEDYKGKRYYFCCENCDAKFRKDPEKYVQSPAEPKKEAEEGSTKKG